MSLDRAATLRQAEKLLRQGRLEQAIAEYRRLVDDQPRDRTIANQLGDLLARAGRPREAIEQYTRIADSLAAEGFLSKASALYKKILRLAPQDDHALLQAAELAAAQRLLVEARSFFAAAAEQRRARGDTAGVARIVVRLGTIDPGDAAARIAAARARVELDDPLGATGDLAQFAAELVEEGRDDDALQALRALLELDHTNSRARAETARILHRRGDIAAASAYITEDEAANDPDLTVAAADWRIRHGDPGGGIALVDRLLNAGGEQATRRVAPLAIALAADEPETAYRIVERVTDACILRNDWPGAVQVLRRFSDARPEQLSALTRLVEVCVDAGDAAALVDAQARLADAYLSSGFASEARYVAEDLLAREPREPAHVERLRRVLRRSGDTDPDRTIAQVLAESQDPVLDPPSGEAVAAGSQNGVGSPEELDLGTLLDDLPPATLASAPKPSAVLPPTDIEEVFAHLRQDALSSAALPPAELAFRRGKALLDAGDLESSIDPLRTAAREPARRFAAASLLGMVFERQQRMTEAIEWLGHAADAPVAEAGDRHRVLLQLADLLERSGESARALGVCLELQADAGDFEDVTMRIARLSRGQA